PLPLALQGFELVSGGRPRLVAAQVLELDIVTHRDLAPLDFATDAQAHADQVLWVAGQGHARRRPAAGGEAKKRRPVRREGDPAAGGNFGQPGDAAAGELDRYRALDLPQIDLVERRLLVFLDHVREARAEIFLLRIEYRKNLVDDVIVAGVLL